MTLKTIDLFAGIGGMRLGFENAGFETAYANDFEPSCKVTYDANSPHVKLDLGDIQQVDPTGLPSYDVLLGGFPCQPFSVAGYQDGFNDKKGRGNLFFTIYDILKETRPRAFLLENVKNLKTHDKKRTFLTIMSHLEEKLGYTVKVAILNSMDYGGVPQNRERIYLVGFTSESEANAFSFPEKIRCTTTVQDLLERNVDSQFYYDDKPLYNKIASDVIDPNIVYQYRRFYVRANKSGVCPTLTANMGEGGHNVPIVRDARGIRKLTPRECARLQGFSDDFILPESLRPSKLYKQFGNTVTVSVVSRIAENIRHAFESDAHARVFVPVTTEPSKRPVRELVTSPLISV
jgi:DNA (cytosine-5)-methyltransferase 1